MKFYSKVKLQNTFLYTIMGISFILVIVNNFTILEQIVFGSMMIFSLIVIFIIIDNL
jgi:hypothetical protein